jgi:hypothetical protein
MKTMQYDIRTIPLVTCIPNYLLYAFFRVIPRRLNFISQCLGTLCLFQLHRQVGVGVCGYIYLPMKMGQSVPKRRHIKFRRHGISQKKAYNIQNTAKIWNQEYVLIYLLTPKSKVFPEMLTYSEIFKKFPTFCGTRRSIMAITSARHLSLSWARSIGDMYKTLFSRYAHFCHKSNKIAQHPIKKFH